MGKEIVYCGDCGKSLREDDFSKGKAQHLDHRPYCSSCKPLAPAPSQIQTSSKLAAMKTTTGRHTPAPSTRRRQAAEDSSKTPILVGAGLVFVAAILLIVFAMSSGGRSSAPEEAPAPAPVVGPPKPAPKVAAPAPNVDKAAAAIKDLEALVAAPSPPVAVLQRCEEIRAVVQGTVHEGRLKSIEDRAREDRRVQQLDASLEEVKKLRALDPAYERKEEIVRLLNATLPLSGARRIEVEETLRTYQRDAQAYVPTAPLPAAVRPTPPPAAIAEALGPYDTDAAGNVNHWLVLGPFKNRASPDGMYDGDHLRSEATHVPSAGLEATTREGTRVRWTPVVVADGKLDFTQGLSSPVSAGTPTIAYAACWLVLESELEFKFKMFADLGYMLYLDGQRQRNQPRGHRFGEEEDVIRLKLPAGPHLMVVKLASPSGLPYFRLKLTQNSGEKMRGLRIWNQAPATRSVIFAQAFTEGLDGFSGSLADDGGSKALSVAPNAGRDRIFTSPITPRTTIRFKVKLLNDLRSFQVLMWSNKVKQNYWVHVRNLPKGEWTTVEFKLADARGGYGMNGPSPVDDLPVSLGFHAEGAGPEGRALVKDLEISE